MFLLCNRKQFDKDFMNRIFYSIRNIRAVCFLLLCLIATALEQMTMQSLRWMLCSYSANAMVFIS